MTESTAGQHILYVDTIGSELGDGLAEILKGNVAEERRCSKLASVAIERE